APRGQRRRGSAPRPSAAAGRRGRGPTTRIDSPVRRRALPPPRASRGPGRGRRGHVPAASWSSLARNAWSSVALAYTRGVRLALPLCLALVAALGVGCQGPGAPKPGVPPHHLEGGYRNLNPAYARPDFWTRWTFVIPRLFKSTFSAPESFPVDANDGTTLRENTGTPTVTWVGHSTVLVQLDGVSFLTDPQWSDRASPFTFAGPRRVVPPGLRFEDLPSIDFVLVSHDHYDHLDAPTVKRLWAVHRPRFFVPLGLKAWFAELGIDDVEELDWWDSRTIKGLTVMCLPTQHWSARTLWDQNERLWASWAVLGRERRFYFAGDTG